MARFQGSTEDVYPVGLLSDWIQFRGWLRYADPTSPHYLPPWRTFRRRFVSSTFGRAQRREWRAIRNYFNGYLAEDERVPMCGRGWTRAAALRSLNRWRRHYGVHP